MSCIPFGSGSVQGVICFRNTFELTLSNGRVIPFEHHAYLGPMPLNKKGDELLRVPSEFYDKYTEWRNKNCDANGYYKGENNEH